MSRNPRVDVEGCWYHVIARGNERKRIFTDREERRFYLGLLDETARLGGADFSAYSLVPNHVHLLIRRGRRTLAGLMQRVQGNYAAFFNRKHRRTGHLFEGRYNAYLVTDEKYLDTLIRYIHDNLPKANLKAENGDVLWSSHPFYAGKKRSQWRQFRRAPGYEGRRGTEAYRQLMDMQGESGLPPVSEEGPCAYGTRESWRKFERRKGGRAANQRREKREIDSMDEIVKRISRKRDVDISLLRSASRHRSVSRIRNEAVLACLRAGHGPSEISRYFARHPSSVATIVRRYGDPRKENKTYKPQSDPVTETP